MHLLVDSLNRFTEGDLPIELTWKDVAIHSYKILNARENVVFMTQKPNHAAQIDD